MLAADILVEEGPPGRLERLGLNPAELRAAKPSLVIMSISPFGQTGPYRDYKSTNIVSFAMGGIMSLTGAFDRQPLVSGGSQAQYLGGLHGFAAAVTAHLGAVLNGEGDWIDISLQDVSAGMLELYAPSTAVGGPVLPRMGNQTRAEWGIYPLLDGWVGIFALQRQVRNLFDAIGDPELTDGPLSTRSTGWSTPRNCRPSSTCSPSATPGRADGHRPHAQGADRRGADTE